MEGKATGLGGNGKENERRRRLLHTAEKKKEVEEVSKSLGPGPARRGSTSYIVRENEIRKERKAVHNIMDRERQSKQTRKEKSSTQIAERANKSQRLCTGRSHSRCLPFYCVAV